MAADNEIQPITIDSVDWIGHLPDSDHARFFASFDWAKTDLGALTTWSLELRLYTLQAFADARPVCLWGGRNRTSVYNEAYIRLAGEKHPSSMGSTFLQIFAEVADVVIPMFEKAESDRTTALLDGVPLTLIRNRFVEETYFDVSFVPLMRLDGTVGGLYNAPTEITHHRLGERRSIMLKRISTSSEQFSSTTIYKHILECFETNRHDVPFALLFTVETESEDGNHDIKLVESLGLLPDVASEKRQFKLYDQEGVMPLLRASQTEAHATPVSDSFGDIITRDIVWGGHGEPSQCLTTLPLSGAGRLYGFLVVGNNPRRPIDSQHDQFMIDLQGRLTAAIATTINAEAVRERNERLLEQLNESERQIRYMAQHSDIGMMQLTLDGSLIWANQHYHTAINKEDSHQPRQTFIMPSQVLEEDCDIAKTAWQQVLQGHRAEATELRLKRQYTPPVGNSIPSTIILSAFPYIETGQVKSIMACMTDVSRLKWAESWQAQMAHDAKEAKRQQSEFTDAISHEVRNPLSVILQLADSITGSLDGIEENVQDCKQRLRENVEAARTILSCAQHQKRIVDDVLTLSKMDFTSISLAPTSVRPEEIVQEALRLVEADATARGISVVTILEPSIQENIPWRVMCDSLRVTQVLVNLLSNAIKFTKLETRRSVTVSYGATSSTPTEAFPSSITWAPGQNKHGDATLASEWGMGDYLYLTFKVEDTGSGMTPEQLNRIFERFEQATPKTSIKYGGSGLGLFISHSLTEKQSGRIGVASTLGSGSTFAFYIKVRQAQRPADLLLEPTSSAHSERLLVNGDSIVSSTSKILRRPLKKKNKTTASSSFHILLVEDNLINQQVLRKQLVKAGCTVHVANHGLEALSFLNTSMWWAENAGQGPKLDVVLLDWEMPVMDGLSCIREIRALEKAGRFTRHPEVIAVTANVRAEQVKIAEEAGMDALMPKPFVVADLLDLIHRRLEQWVSSVS